MASLSARYHQHLVVQNKGSDVNDLSSYLQRIGDAYIMADLRCHAGILLATRLRLKVLFACNIYLSGRILVILCKSRGTICKTSEWFVHFEISLGQRIFCDISVKDKYSCGLFQFLRAPYIWYNAYTLDIFLDYGKLFWTWKPMRTQSEGLHDIQILSDQRSYV